METGLAVAKLAGGFTVVAGLLFAGVFALRRWGPALAARRGGLPITVLSERPLSSRQRLVVAEVEGRRYLLGVSAQEIRLLASLGGAAERAFQPPPAFPEGSIQ